MSYSVGDMVPDELGLDQNGNEVRRSDYPGKSVALYFYPKDMTSGCTAQACNPGSNTQLRAHET
ncbi:MAG: redoxin domain-containing protein, partial [Muribaculaceae bacterium]|nr:redoxin domain-containing protein [Muribaculaceae bacterium]